jgi:hypothetical protein
MHTMGMSRRNNKPREHDSHVDENPRTTQISIVLHYEIFLLNFAQQQLFLHEIVINMLVV